MAALTNYRKMYLFYADDLSENVRSLLDGIQRAGLIKKSDNSKLIMNLPDKKEHYEHNRNIFQSEACLINIDYSTKIDDAIDKIRENHGDYDLVICDLYFGDNDEDYAESKIGGIWPIFWAMQLAHEKKIVCKLYSGRLKVVVENIDYKKAIEFIEEAYHISVEEIEKAHDAGSWCEHLQEYLYEVLLNILPQIEANERVDFLNYIAGRLRRDQFENKVIVDKRIDQFKKDLLALQDREFNMIDGRKINLIHLFPILLGSHFTTDDRQNFANMDIDHLERTLYKSEKIYNTREERDVELKRLQLEKVDYEDFRKHDETGRPIYGIRFRSFKYDMGIISQIENSFIQSLDWTYQIYRFYKSQQGFGYWSGSSSISPFRSDEFDRIRKNIILPSFKKIEKCFEKSDPEFMMGHPLLADQIEYTLENIDESKFLKKEGYGEQQIEHGFQKLKSQLVFNNEAKDTILPLKSLFRIKVPDFFKIVLHVREGEDYIKYESDEFQRIREPKFYWYCNAFIVRGGLKSLRESMQGDNPLFYILESRDKGNELIKYKIILRDSGKGIPSIIRKFNCKEKSYKFINLLEGFCQLIIRSKMNDFEGISFNVFTGRDEIPCPRMTKTGTEFEIMFTQGRER